MQKFKLVEVVGSPPRYVEIRYDRPPYPLNDFAVTRDSARHPLFDDPGFYWRKNHTTIGQEDVSNYIRTSIDVGLEKILRGSK